MPVTEPNGRRTVGWTPAKIKSAEQQAEGGKLLMAADLCEAMFGDDRYSGVMQTLSNVVSLPLSFIPGTDGADADTDPACVALGGARGDWWQMLPETTLAEVVPWLRTLGLALLHVSEWVKDENSDRVVAVVEVWSPRWLSMVDNRWEVETSDGKRTIEPGDGEWMIWTSYRKNRPWAIAPWRGLARWWLAKAFAILDEMDISDKQGDVLRVAEQMSVEYNVSDEQRQKMVTDLRALGRRGVYVAPPMVTLKNLESQGKGADICARIIEQANTAFAVTHLGGNLSAEVTGGSFAAASVHSQVTHDRIRSVAELISTEARYQLLVHWNELNYGSTLAPWPVYDTTPPADRQALANQMSTVSQAVATLAGLGLPIDAAALVERYQLPIALDQMESPVLQTQAGNAPVPQARWTDVRTVAAAQATDRLDEAEQTVDQIEEQARVALVRDRRPKVDALAAIVKASGVEYVVDEESRVKALKDLRTRVLDLYGELDPALYAETQERVEVLAAMTGGWSATSEA